MSKKLRICISSFIKQVFENFGEMSAAKLIEANYSLKIVKTLVFCVLKALSAAHAGGIIHRDIKPQNVVVEKETGRARLIDWGLAEFYEPGKDLNVRVSTKPFKPPEILLNYRYYDCSFDMWGVGCLLACLVNLAAASTATFNSCRRFKRTT